MRRRYTLGVPVLSFVVATQEHFDAIVEIERGAGVSSVVALTGGRALQEALDRGHWVIVALDGGSVAGWIWFSVELDRGGEYTGHIFRIGVAPTARRTGVATALFVHARSVFAERHATRIRANLDAADADAQAFLEAVGFTPASLTMERAL